MEQREAGLDEVEKRCKPLFNSLKLKDIIRLPDRQVDEDDMPCILILEGDDSITKRATGDFLGYPCKRDLDVVIECWDKTSVGDVRNIYREVRKAVLANKGSLVDKAINIREKKATGPLNFGVPGVLGIRIIFSMSYTDQGPNFNS